MIIILADHDSNKPLKFDTNKMEVVSASIKVGKSRITILGDITVYVNAVLYKSKKDRYLLSYKINDRYKYELLSEEAAKNLLINDDIDAYERLFGEIEEG